MSFTSLRMPSAVLLGPMNVYQMHLYASHSQSVQLYQMTYDTLRINKIALQQGSMGKPRLIIAGTSPG